MNSTSETTWRWEDMTLEKREEEYSPSSRIDNIEPYISAYIAKSEEARKKIGEGKEFSYGSRPSQRIDFFVPPNNKDKKFPLLVFIHGGYWQELSKKESSFAAPAWVENEIAFAAIDYTLAPEVSLQEIVKECQDAISWMISEAEQLSIDTNRIVLVGSSAGAHLAAMTAMEIPVRATVLISGIYELRPLVGTYINEALNLNLNEAKELSPLHKDLRDFPETVICWGEIETEEFKTQSRQFANRLTDQEIPSMVFEVAERNHFDVVFELTDLSTQMGRELLSYLREV
ncbi:MAG TPA: alpha/beta hydrolase [Acidimicrobiales bacterium]|nr:alpha/beta hydrolase [Acidimicrobiales bacterium]